MTLPPRKAPKAEQPGDIDTELVRVLARLLQETDLSEIEVERGDFRVRVVRQLAGQPAQLMVAAPAPRMVAAPVVLAAGEADAPIALSANAVPSPMVGTAYRRASPGSKAFVEVGSKVALGEKILLIEAMKTFNDIVAPRAGTVSAIMIDDGQPVEYGQPLMVID